MEMIAKGINGAEGPVVDRCGRLFCVEPPTGKVLEVRPDGTLRDHANTGGIPAGLAIDSNGNIWVADMKLGILRIDSAARSYDEVREFEGKPIERLQTEFAQPSNLHFGGADGRTLFITEHTNNAIWKTTWKHPGMLAMRLR